MEQSIPEPPKKSRVGRPRRGTECARADALMAAATRVFLRDGYGAASIDRVASEAGVSTRTIYERFKNKADLLGAVTMRLVECAMDTVLATEELDRLEPRQALSMIGVAITRRASAPQTAALFRILATEAHRFPELAAKMRGNSKKRVDDGVAAYLRRQVSHGRLAIDDPERAGTLFLHMVTAELQECLLFGTAEELGKLDLEDNVAHVVDIFLRGALPRSDRPVGERPPI